MLSHAHARVVSVGDNVKVDLLGALAVVIGDDSELDAEVELPRRLFAEAICVPTAR